MARIDVLKMKKKEKATYSVHEEDVATYSTFVKDGEKYFQIDTYGIKGQEHSGSASQHIQFDKKNAIELIALLQKTFNL